MMTVVSRPRRRGPVNRAAHPAGGLAAAHWSDLWSRPTWVVGRQDDELAYRSARLHVAMGIADLIELERAIDIDAVASLLERWMMSWRTRP